jgi:S1-C subfamily serine protease
MKLSDLSKEIVDLVASIKDGVVSITTIRVGLDSFLRPQPIKGVGSGFIVDERGFIITNYHVIRVGRRADIILSNGMKYTAELVSSDPSLDLALLKIDEGDIKPLRLGDSDKIEVGELVIAVGSPLGLPGPNVTVGVISALGRNIEGRGIILEDLIQTDAAINPGNSGGPLINMDGEVIGVTTAMIPYAQGISFAIPINSVKRFIDMIRKYGRPIHPKIGVYISDITPQMQSYYGLPISHGVLIVRVIFGSPAQIAGLREGDIIVSANGREIRNSRMLRREIENSIEEGYVRLGILTKDGVREIDVKLIIE